MAVLSNPQNPYGVESQSWHPKARSHARSTLPMAPTSIPDSISGFNQPSGTTPLKWLIPFHTIVTSSVGSGHTLLRLFLSAPAGVQPHQESEWFDLKPATVVRYIKKLTTHMVTVLLFGHNGNNDRYRLTKQQKSAAVVVHRNPRAAHERIGDTIPYTTNQTLFPPDLLALFRRKNETFWHDVQVYRDSSAPHSSSSFFSSSFFSSSSTSFWDERRGGERRATRRVTDAMRHKIARAYGYATHTRTIK
jgi:hypothetical protein